MIRTKQMIKARPITQKDRWRTDLKLFKPLNDEFGFTLDPCCEADSALCKKYYTEKEDGLIQDWQGEVVYCNPPYSNGNIDRWMEKCYMESLKPNTTVVALIPVSTSSRWWHSFIMNKTEVRYIERRVKFVGAKGTAPFSSAIVVWGRTGAKSWKQ